MHTTLFLFYTSDIEEGVFEYMTFSIGVTACKFYTPLAQKLTLLYIKKKNYSTHVKLWFIYKDAWVESLPVKSQILTQSEAHSSKDNYS